MTVHPPRPGESYTLQGVATVDDANQKVHALLGGSSGDQSVYFDRLPGYLGASAHVQVRDIRWTGQIGDSGEPQTIAEFDAPISAGRSACSSARAASRSSARTRRTRSS